tara:strand:- start:2325 stop:3395 length:1071 start_codon:yes stop_codon:yes gene_type:complete
MGDHSEAGDESALFDAVFAGSTMLNDGAPLPAEDAGDLEDASDDLEDDDDSTNENDDEGDDGAADEDANGDDDNSDEDDSTEDPEDEAEAGEGEVDWEFEVPVKIDGVEGNVTLEELRKGYQTQEHLSKQGRELGEEKTAFEAEKVTQMERVTSTADILQAQVKVQENDLATKYNELKDRSVALKKEGDKFGANELKDEMEEIQSDYWKAVQTREALEANVAKARETDATQKFAKELEVFTAEIHEMIPDFDSDRAVLIRDFAVGEGIPESLLNVLASAGAVKFIDDYRQMKEGLGKGAARKKKVIAKKITPTKKSTTNKAKAVTKNKVLSSRLKAGEATEEEGFDFLRNMANKYV